MQAAPLARGKGKHSGSTHMPCPLPQIHSQQLPYTPTKSPHTKSCALYKYLACVLKGLEEMKEEERKTRCSQVLTGVCFALRKWRKQRDGERKGYVGKRRKTHRRQEGQRSTRGGAEKKWAVRAASGFGPCQIQGRQGPRKHSGPSLSEWSAGWGTLPFA